MNRDKVPGEEVNVRVKGLQSFLILTKERGVMVLLRPQKMMDGCYDGAARGAGR
jgi:hypothetical protein